MLAEYALIPDIFDQSCYNSDELCGFHLQILKRALLEDALVRDLHGGAWQTYVHQKTRQACHPKARELLKKLRLQHRLRSMPAASVDRPPSINDWLIEDWCAETIASHGQEPINGAIATRSTAHQYPTPTKKQPPLIAAIDQLQNIRWWQTRSSSRVLHRQTADYLDALRLVFAQARSILFIDPYLNPRKPNFREFQRLLAAIDRPIAPPLLEVHLALKGYDSDNPDGLDPVQISGQAWRNCFSAWLPTLRDRQLRIEVFIWDQFHDRYLISDLIGIQAPAGFDVSRNPQETTTWTRISREARDKIQQQFSRNSTHHKLIHHFHLPS